MTTNDDTANTFSDGHTLTGWLVKLGAPSPILGVSYRISTRTVGCGPGAPTEVTITVHNSMSNRVEARATEVTRVGLDMAAVAAAQRAYEEFICVRSS